MNQNRWIALKRAIPWRKLEKKAQPIWVSQRLPLSSRNLLGSIMIQQLDDLSDIQLGKLLPEHHHYRVFAEISPKISSPDVWLEKWSQCREMLGDSAWADLVSVVTETIHQLPPSVMDAFLLEADAHTDNGFMENLPKVTKREYQVLCHMADVTPIEDIATELYIAPNTVRTHKRNVRRKLGITDVTNGRVLVYKKWVERLRPLFN
jgi:DNA-binding CsgD family transcriptional regulator